MVIYEVNLDINNAIFHPYYTWLLEHINSMLQFQGFKRAEISEEKHTEPHASTKKLTVRYLLESEKDLDDYLNTHALAMRQEGIATFGHQFTATRRIFLRTASIECKADQMAIS